MKPIRIQRIRQHKQVSPNGLPIKYCGRPGEWGNPFRVVEIAGKWQVKCEAIDIQAAILTHVCRLEYDSKQDAAKDAVRCYEYYMIPTKFFPETKGITLLTAHNEAHIKKELAGKNLSCWCKVGEPCHVDVLLEIANKK